MCETSCPDHTSQLWACNSALFHTCPVSNHCRIFTNHPKMHVGYYTSSLSCTNPPQLEYRLCTSQKRHIMLIRRLCQTTATQYSSWENLASSTRQVGQIQWVPPVAKISTLGIMGVSATLHLGWNPMPANPRPSSSATVFTCKPHSYTHHFLHPTPNIIRKQNPSTELSRDSMWKPWAQA
jgi:hypothetical protein